MSKGPFVIENMQTSTTFMTSTPSGGENKTSNTTDSEDSLTKI